MALNSGKFLPELSSSLFAGADPAKIVTAAQGWGHKRAWSKIQNRPEGEIVEIYKLL